MLRGLENQDCAWVMAGSWVDANIIAYGERAMKTMHPVAFPRGPSAKPNEYGVYTGALGISMFANSKNKQAAWDAIKVFVSPKISGIYAGGLHVPARSDVPDEYIIEGSKGAFPNTYNDHLRIIKEFQELKQYGRARPEPMGFNAMFIVIQEAMVELFTSSNPNTESIYAKIKTGIDNIVAQYK
jgi:ABC-type glycerol-3-phosphate transport system substrate-binding protein